MIFGAGLPNVSAKDHDLISIASVSSTMIKHLLVLIVLYSPYYRIYGPITYWSGFAQS
jgi:hypothetical protein